MLTKKWGDRCRNSSDGKDDGCVEGSADTEGSMELVGACDGDNDNDGIEDGREDSEGPGLSLGVETWSSFSSSSEFDRSVIS